MVIKDGRFGPYVTDGETNASLRAGDEPSAIGPERAAEMLQARRDAIASGAVPAQQGPGQEGGQEVDGQEAPAAPKKPTKKAAKKSTAPRPQAAKKPASDDA